MTLLYKDSRISVFGISWRKVSGRSQVVLQLVGVWLVARNVAFVELLKCVALRERHVRMTQVIVEMRQVRQLIHFGLVIMHSG